MMFAFHCAATSSFFFFFNDTATTEIYTLSLHDALPISRLRPRALARGVAGVRSEIPHDRRARRWRGDDAAHGCQGGRSEEHTSELQSRQYLVCRLLLEKKKTRVEYEKDKP